MECNKAKAKTVGAEEAAFLARNKAKAIRAKEIAEKMFTARDILGAMKFALSARNLFPGLEGITHMVTIFGVYIASMNRINGERDWYGILGVSPLADDDTLSKQCNELILAFQKNNCIGAHEAFQLISQAWRILSDKAKRVAYDEKVNKTLCTLSTECDPPASSGANCDDNLNKPNTFWTFCHRCQVHYEYVRAYVNHKLVCHNCYEMFCAVETERPAAGVYRCAAAWSFLRNRKTFNRLWLVESNFHLGPLLRTSIFSSAARAARSVQIQQASEKAKRKREGAQATKREQVEFNPAKVRRALEEMNLSNKPEEDGRISEHNNAKSLLQNLLTQVDIEEITMKLKELKSDTDECQGVDEKGETFLRSSDACDQNNTRKKSEGRMSGSEATKPFAGTSTMADMVTKSLEKMSIDVTGCEGSTEGCEQRKDALINEGSGREYSTEAERMNTQPGRKRSKAMAAQSR